MARCPYQEYALGTGRFLSVTSCHNQIDPLPALLLHWEGALVAGRVVHLGATRSDIGAGRMGSGSAPGTEGGVAAFAIEIISGCPIVRSSINGALWRRVALREGSRGTEC